MRTAGPRAGEPPMASPRFDHRSTGRPRKPRDTPVGRRGLDGLAAHGGDGNLQGPVGRGEHHRSGCAAAVNVAHRTSARILRSFRSGSMISLDYYSAAPIGGSGNGVASTPAREPASSLLSEMNLSAKWACSGMWIKCPRFSRGSFQIRCQRDILMVKSSSSTSMSWPLCFRSRSTVPTLSAVKAVCGATLEKSRF